MKENDTVVVLVLVADVHICQLAGHRVVLAVVGATLAVVSFGHCVEFPDELFGRLLYVFEQALEALRVARVEVRIRIGLGQRLAAQPAKVVHAFATCHLVASAEFVDPAAARRTLLRSGRDQVHAGRFFESALYALLAVLALQLFAHLLVAIDVLLAHCLHLGCQNIKENFLKKSNTVILISFKPL